MKKKYFGFILFLVALLLSISYCFIHPQWVAYRKAENSFKKENYSKSIKYYLLSIKKGLDPDLTSKLAKACLVLGRYSAAVNFYEELIKKDEKNINLIIGLATFYVEINELDKATAVYTKFLVNNPNNIELLFSLAKVYGYDKNYEFAIETYLEVLKFPLKEKVRFQAQLNLARIYTCAKKLKMAEKVYKRIINGSDEVNIELVNVSLEREKYLKALDLLEKISGDIDDLSQLVIADLYAYNGNFEKTKKIYNKYLKNHEDDFEMQEKYEKIISGDIEAFLKKDRVYSEDEDSVLVLSRIYQRNREYQKALDGFFHILKTEKKQDYEILFEIGNTYLFDKKIDEAIVYFEKALALKPKDKKLKIKLAFALSWNKDDKKAFQLLSKIYRKDPKNQAVGLEIARIYIRDNEITKADNLLNKLIKEFPENRNIAVEDANFEAIIGHPLKSKQLFLELLTLSKFRKDIYLRFADSLSASGDFYKAEDIYRDFLLKNPKNAEVKFKLAFLLASTERYEEAQAIYKKMIFEKIQVDRCYMKLSEMKLMIKEDKIALFYARKAYELDENGFSKLLLAKCLFFTGEFDDALEIFYKLEINGRFQNESLFYLAKIYEKLNKKEKAEKYFKKVLNLDEKNIEAQFAYLDFSNELQKYENLLNETTNTLNLKKLAELYAAKGFYDISMKFYKKALSIDFDFYPAKLSIALLNGITHNYLAALDQLNDLELKLLDNYKIMLWKARVYGWGKYFDKSINEYQKILTFRREDPVIIREMARVAAWSKDVYLAIDFYNLALCARVDSLLLKRLVRKSISNRELIEDSFCEPKQIFQVYEKIKSNLAMGKYDLSKEKRKDVEKVLLDLSAKYEIQKSIYLEKQSKWEYFQKRYASASFYLNDLVCLHSYNQEALFDLAQVQCILGLCNQSKNSYEKLLKIDPLHNIVNLALKRNKIVSNPYLGLKHEYYKEAGRGDIDRVIRNKTDFEMGFPICCNHVLELSATRWAEKPTFEKNSQIKDKDQLQGITYPAYGYSVGYEGVLSKYIKAKAGFTQKFFLNSFRNTNTGLAHIWFNLDDYVHLGFGYDRVDKIDNIFSLRQRMQTGSTWVKANATIKRKIDLKGMLKFVAYSDSNQINHYRFDFEYRLTRFPKVLKFGIYGEYRNSRKLNIFQFEGASLVNIIHPYWTPNNYNGFRGMIEWYHNISDPLICSNQVHFYDLKVLSGTDTEQNPTIIFEGEWRYGIKDHFTFGIKGVLHRSKLWDSQSIWADIKYQF